MTFTVNSITPCSGGSHWDVTVTIGGQQFTSAVDRSELQLEPSHEARREAILTRIRSAAKEAGATTLATVRTAVVGNSYQV